MAACGRLYVLADAVWGDMKACDSYLAQPEESKTPSLLNRIKLMVISRDKGNLQTL